jgi:hypothetical protein
MFYPIYLNLNRRRVVVIGGGEVAERKVESLLGTGASIMVVSPVVTPQLESLAEENKIQLHRRVYTAGDCKHAALVFSATDDADVSAAVFEEAARAGALVNTADQPALCDFIIGRNQPWTCRSTTAKDWERYWARVRTIREASFAGARRNSASRSRSRAAQGFALPHPEFGYHRSLETQ